MLNDYYPSILYPTDWFDLKLMIDKAIPSEASMLHNTLDILYNYSLFYIG